MDFISLEQEVSGLANLADKVSTMTHKLDCTTNQPSATVPAQANSSSSNGQSIPTSPTPEAEEVNLASSGTTSRQPSSVCVDANSTTLNTAMVTTIW